MTAPSSPRPDPTRPASPIESTAAAWLETATGERLLVRCPCSLGRAASNSIPLADERMSRRHASITVRGPSEFWLTDHDSSNGSFLNGRRLRQTERLFDQDQITVGRSTFTFHTSEAQSRMASQRTLSGEAVTSGFTSRHWLLLLELAPDSPNPVQNQHAIDQCRQMIEARGGVVDRYVPDGLLAQWPERESTPVAVAAALGELGRFQDQAPSALRLVLHLGHAASLSPGTLVEAGLQGPAIHHLFRMEKLCQQLPLRILVSRTARDRLETHLALRHAGEHELPGTRVVEAFFTL